MSAEKSLDAGAVQSDAGGKKTAGASSARRVMQLLLSFSESRPDASVAELAELLDLPLPTTYRHVALLKELEVLAEGPPGRYHPTTKLMPVAQAAQMSNSLADLARPVVAATSARVRETVMLLQRMGNVAICVELTECDRPMRYTFQRGHSIPLGRGATGKLMVALMSPEERAVWEQAHPLDDARRAEIDAARAQGYAMSVSELDDGVFACSVPVASVHGRPFVLTMAGPAARISEDQRMATVHILRDAALRIRQAASGYGLDSGGPDHN